MAQVNGIAAKTLIKKSLVQLLVSSDKSYNMALAGIAGERKASRVLKQLPDGWRVWHDLKLDGENIDHLVASSKGLFIIEVKNYAGSVLATPQGLYTHRNKEPNDKVTAQVWRQVYRLKALLKGHPIQPILVFIDEVKGDKARGIPCLHINDLMAYLRLRDNVLSYEQAKHLFEMFDEITK
jgi:glutaredoxin-related protein